MFQNSEVGRGHPRELCCESLHSLNWVWLFSIPWTVACKAPLSKGFFFQARILEQVAVAFSRGSSQPRGWTCILPPPALAGGFFTTVSPGKPAALWREAGQGRSCGTLLEELFGGFTLNEKGMHCWVLPFFCFVFLPFLLRCNWHTSLYKFRGVHHSDLTSIHQEMIITVSLVTIHRLL